MAVKMERVLFRVCLCLCHVTDVTSGWWSIVCRCNVIAVKTAVTDALRAMRLQWRQLSLRHCMQWDCSEDSCHWRTACNEIAVKTAVTEALHAMWLQWRQLSLTHCVQCDCSEDSCHWGTACNEIAVKTAVTEALRAMWLQWRQLSQRHCMQCDCSEDSCHWGTACNVIAMKTAVTDALHAMWLQWRHLSLRHCVQCDCAAARWSVMKWLVVSVGESLTEYKREAVWDEISDEVIGCECRWESNRVWAWSGLGWDQWWSDWLWVQVRV